MYDHKPPPGRVLTVMVLAGLLIASSPAPLFGVTKAQVDAACADSQAQLAQYRDAQSAFEEAALQYERILNEVARVELKQSIVEGSVQNHAAALESIQDQIEQQAVELYMRGGFSSPGILFAASSVDEVITSSEFLNAAALSGLQALDDLIAARGELRRFQGELTDTRNELKEVEAERLTVRNAQEAAMAAEQQAYARLSGRCKELTTQYDAEQRALAAAREQRARGSIQVGSFVCPFTPGRTSFIDSYGFPRPGGRTHKGTDLFAPYGEPMYAVVGGRVSIGTNTLGGKTIHLYAGNGITYYYAHLSGWNVSSGQSVSQGQTIGFNGDSGNASGTSPHLHFELRKNGVPYNPYPTLAAACK